MSETNAVFSEFLKEIDPRTKMDFLNALGEHELFDFCSSQEEFGVIMGRDPKREFRERPEQQEDVDDPEEGLREKIQERFDKFEAAFPQTKTLDTLKEHAREKTQPQVQVTINLGQMRERAGTEKPQDAEAHESSSEED